jgi:hypothetical protein
MRIAIFYLPEFEELRNIKALPLREFQEINYPLPLRLKEGGFCTEVIDWWHDLIPKPAPTRIFLYLEIPNFPMQQVRK